MNALEAKLRRLAVSLDSVALVALANKGLLRRAQKDSERGIEVRVTGGTDTRLKLTVGEFEVTLPESGPATAACSCPADGICQHILTAVLFLQREAQQGVREQLPGVDVAETTGSPEQELMAISPEQLERWAGKAVFKAGQRIASEVTLDIVLDRTIRLRFPTMNSEIHVIAGGGLDGIIVSGGKGDGRSLVVAAVIGFQRASGREWAFPAKVAALEASGGAPRSRPEVLESCQKLLAETLDNGLSRISNANQQRWSTLAVSALGVNLPRLALTLRGIGDEAAIVLARDARSDVARMLARMAQAHALCSALQNGGESPRQDLVGLHRTRYNEVGHLDLVGVAAWPWRTASGYEGLTVLFWDSAGKFWNSWTESRPRHQLADFKPVGRYSQPGPWEGAESPRQIARSAFRLINARRNPGNRLSASTRSRVLVTGPANPRELGLVGIEDWSQLDTRLSTQTTIGLKEANPLDSIVAIQPATWGEREFDAVTQVFTWVLGDAQQRPLPLEISFEEYTEPAIKMLEGMSAESLRDALIIGRIQLTRRGPSLHPYSIHRQDGEIVHVCLDHAKPVADGPVAPQSDVEHDFENEEEAEAVAAFSPAFGRLLDKLDDGLLALAEGGLAGSKPLHVEHILQVIPHAERLGFSGLASGLGHLRHRPGPQSVLRCAYLGQLHRRALPVSLSL